MIDPAENQAPHRVTPLEGKVIAIQVALEHVAEIVTNAGKKIDQIPELRTQLQLVNQRVGEMQHVVMGNGREGFIEFRVQVNDILDTLMDDYQRRKKDEHDRVREDRRFRRQIRWTIAVQFGLVVLAWVLAVGGSA